MADLVWTTDTSPAANMNSRFQASAVDPVQVLRGLAFLHYILHVVRSVCVCVTLLYLLLSNQMIAEIRRSPRLLIMFALI